VSLALLGRFVGRDDSTSQHVRGLSLHVFLSRMRSSLRPPCTIYICNLTTWLGGYFDARGFLVACRPVVCGSAHEDFSAKRHKTKERAIIILRDDPPLRLARTPPAILATYSKFGHAFEHRAGWRVSWRYYSKFHARLKLLDAVASMESLLYAVNVLRHLAASVNGFKFVSIRIRQNLQTLGSTFALQILARYFYYEQEERKGDHSLSCD